MEYVEAQDVNISYNLAEDDRLFYCPYNRSHQVRVGRAAIHLEICRKAYVKSPAYPKDKDKIVQCQWRPTKHHLRRSKVEGHEKECEGNKAQLFAQFKNISLATSPSAFACGSPQSTPKGGAAGVTTYKSTSAGDADTSKTKKVVPEPNQTVPDDNDNDWED